MLIFEPRGVLMKNVYSALISSLLLGSLAVSCAGADSAPPDDDGSTTETSNGSDSTTNSSVSSGSPDSNSGSINDTQSTSGDDVSDDPSMMDPSDPAESCAPEPADCAAETDLDTLPFADFDIDMGWWLFANPDDPDGSTTPAAGANIGTEEITCPATGLCSTSVLAMHVSGGGFTTYGPTLSHDLVYPAEDEGYTGTPIDASEYTGVMFWARKGDMQGLSPAIGITINDASSHPAGGYCDAEATPKPGSDACFDGWFAQKPVTSKWTLVKIPFSSLKQQGFGKEAMAFDPATVHGITLNLPMQNFEFWIGDVAFYKE